MDSYQALILGVIQGFTEFLPISSSAHLILLPKLTHLPDQGLAFDGVLHFGSLMAVLLYYKKDISQIIYNFFRSNYKHPDAQIGWGLIIATIPVGIFGLIFKDYIETELRSIEVIAFTSIFFGLLLYIADFLHKKKSEYSAKLTLLPMFIIGMFQVLALIPGTSRSGITITGALLLGLNYKLATKFSFLLSIPVIVLSLALILLDISKTSYHFDIPILAIGFITSFVVAYLTIYFFIKAIEKMGMMPFVIYRVILGIILLSL